MADGLSPKQNDFGVHDDDDVSTALAMDYDLVNEFDESKQINFAVNHNVSRIIFKPLVVSSTYLV